jgi:hypothetical protein
VAIITPYDNKVGVWLVHGDDVGETSIDEVAQTILSYAPAINAVWVKTSDGSDWMATYDTKKALAIDGPAAIDRWVNTLQKYGLEFHAWCVPRGLNLDAEANIILQACQRPGVRSMILDVEPYQGFYAGGRDTIRPLMLKIRGALPGSFHIGMSVDPRPGHYAEIFPDEWYPFVNSIHPQVYWATFQVSPQTALASTYKTWGKYGRPIFPALSGFGTDVALMEQARSLAVNTYQATGFSWWAFGHMDGPHLNAANKTVSGAVATTPPGSAGKPGRYGTPIVIKVGSPGYHDGVYDVNKPGFSTYGTSKYRVVDQGVANVWALYNPGITQSGWYKIDAYVPDQHATTGNARYKIHGVKNRPTEWIVSAPQAGISNDWLTLGTFELDTTQPQAGVVFLTDWTFELNREIAWDALRFTPVSEWSGTPVLIDVPYRSQEAADARRYGNDCGPACVAMYIDWVRKVKGLPPQPITVNQLASETALAQRDTGLSTQQLVPLAAKYGVKLALSNSATLSNVLAEVAAGRPPLLLISYAPLAGRQNQADTSGHFLIVTGYDAANIYVNDPDWWDSGTFKAEMGHNWKVPIKQLDLAIRQSPSPFQGCWVSV